jgi:hypothetical protein
MINWLAYTKIPSGAPPLEAWDTVADKSLAVDRYQGLELSMARRPGPHRAHRARTAAAERGPRSHSALEFLPRHLDRRCAHPMQPVGAQAGSQAIVDGRVLAASLLASADPADGARALPRTSASPQ